MWRRSTRSGARRTPCRTARPPRRRRCGECAPAGAGASRSRRFARPRPRPSRPASPGSSCRCPRRPSATGPRPRRGGRRSPRRSSLTALYTGALPRIARHVGDRRAVEADAPVLARDRRGDPARAGAPCGRSRHSQGRATSSGPRIQPEPSQTPSGQAGSGVDSRPPAAPVAARSSRLLGQVDRSGGALAGPLLDRALGAARAGRRTAGTARGRRPARPRWARCGAWR